MNVEWIHGRRMRMNGMPFTAQSTIYLIQVDVDALNFCRCALFIVNGAKDKGIADDEDDGRTVPAMSSVPQKPKN